MKSRLCPILLLPVLLWACQAGFATPAIKTGAPTAEIIPTVAQEDAALPGQAGDSGTAATPGPDSASAPGSATQPQGAADPYQGLPFDDFLQESYLQVMRRDPELITELGLDAAFGMPGDQLTDISDAYQRETYALLAEIKATLLRYDRAALNPDQQLSYDIYAYYLDDLLRGQEFMYYDYPVTHFVTGVQNRLIQFFTDIHPITSKQEAENYLTRLAQVDTKLAQLLEALQLREQAGVITPRLVLEWSLGDIRAIARADASDTPFLTSFAAKVRSLDLSVAEQDDLLGRAEREIEATVIPAFAALADYLDGQILRAPTAIGVWQHPNGEAYYQYAVRHHTTTTGLTPVEIRDLGLQELERIHAEMRVIFAQLGYPADESLPALFERVTNESGMLYNEDILHEYEAIIAAAQEQIKPAFDLFPQAAVIVIGVPVGGYYSGPAVDGSRPGAFYATASGAEPKFGMPTLAYHEAVPGHHTQIALALELDLPSFRRGSQFTAYTEGWALYAERLMWELGIYADDPYGDLGRLQAEAFRAARLVVDPGIHLEGWSFEQAFAFMRENTGMPERLLQFEVARYAAWPGQALAYKIGMIEILDLRQRSEERLGDGFDLKEFHNLVLRNGAVPLEILGQIVASHLDPP